MAQIKITTKIKKCYYFINDDLQEMLFKTVDVSEVTDSTQVIPPEGTG